MKIIQVKQDNLGKRINIFRSKFMKEIKINQRIWKEKTSK